MQVKAVLFSSIISFTASYALGQNKTIDSLLINLKSAGNDTGKVNTLNTLSRQFEQIGNYSKAFQFTNDAFTLSQKINYKKGEGTADITFGWINEDEGNLPEAANNYKTSLKIAEEIGDKKEIASSYLGIGNIYYEQGDYPDALKNYFSALKISEEINNKKTIASLYTNIGEVYSHENNYTEALKNFSSSLKIAEGLGDKRGMAYSYLGIGIMQNDQGNYDAALKNYFICLKISEEIGNTNTITAAYSNIGDIYVKQGNFTEALKNYSASLKLTRQEGNKSGIANCLISLGSLYVKLGKNAEAKKYLDDALALSKEIGSKERMKETYNALSVLDSAIAVAPGMSFQNKALYWQMALEHHKKFILYRDSLENEEDTKKAVQAQMQYAFDKKELEAKAEQQKKDDLALAKLNKERFLRNSFIIGFAALMLFSIIVYNQKKKIAKERERSDHLLLNILPAETAQELKATGTAKSKGYEEVTVLFTDFKNFTSLSERLTAEELVYEINFCYSAFDNIISKYGIEKIKTIGDSYMCAAGLPQVNKNHAFDMVNAALEMQQFMQKLKEERLSADKPFFDMRIGLNSGPVVAGIVGSKKFAYDIWGDTVNIASRMESSGEITKVNISGSTYELIRNDFQCTPRGKITAKGKGEIDMYFVDRHS